MNIAVVIMASLMLVVGALSFLIGAFSVGVLKTSKLFGSIGGVILMIAGCVLACTQWPRFDVAQASICLVIAGVGCVVGGFMVLIAIIIHVRSIGLPSYDEDEG